MREMMNAINPYRIAKQDIQQFSIKGCYDNIKNYTISAGVAGLVLKFAPKARPIGQVFLTIALLVAIGLASYNFFQSYRLTELLFSPSNDSLESRHWSIRTTLFILSLLLSTAIVFSLLSIFLVAIASAAK